MGIHYTHYARLDHSELLPCVQHHLPILLQDRRLWQGQHVCRTCQLCHRTAGRRDMAEPDQHHQVRTDRSALRRCDRLSARRFSEQEVARHFCLPHHFLSAHGLRSCGCGNGLEVAVQPAVRPAEQNHSTHIQKQRPAPFHGPMFPEWSFPAGRSAKAARGERTADGNSWFHRSEQRVPRPPAPRSPDRL